MTSAFKQRGDARLERPEMFTPQERDHRETSTLYEAVVFLRKQGKYVVRVSARQAQVGGYLMTNAELIRFARKTGWGG